MFVRGQRRRLRGTPRGAAEADPDEMTPDTVDRFVGRRVRITRVDGSVFVGLIELDSLSYVTIYGDDVRRSLRYDDISGIEAVDATTPDTE